MQAKVQQHDVHIDRRVGGLQVPGTDGEEPSIDRRAGGLQNGSLGCLLCKMERRIITCNTAV